VYRDREALSGFIEVALGQKTAVHIQGTEEEKLQCEFATCASNWSPSQMFSSKSACVGVVQTAADSSFLGCS